MKKITYCFLLLSVSVFSSCEFNKSVKVDLTTGLTSKGSGLGCDDVFLTVNDERVNRNQFVFGEGFDINFNGFEGFKRVGNELFPGMELLILDKQGDTILYNPDLYADNTNPITKTPLLLSTMITIGNPFRSNRSYTATVHIWDKKGKGTFDTKFKFTVIPNKTIETRSNGITANEVYLYNEEIERGIASNKIPYDEEITLVFDDLNGFKSNNNLCELGMRMVIEDKNGEPVLSEDDLLAGKTIDATIPNKMVFGSFRLPKSVKGPVKLEVIVWDKIGTGKITTTAILELQ